VRNLGGDVIGMWRGVPLVVITVFLYASSSEACRACRILQRPGGLGLGQGQVFNFPQDTFNINGSGSLINTGAGGVFNPSGGGFGNAGNSGVLGDNSSLRLARLNNRYVEVDPFGRVVNRVTVGPNGEFNTLNPNNAVQIMREYEDARRRAEQNPFDPRLRAFMSNPIVQSVFRNASNLGLAGGGFGGLGLDPRPRPPGNDIHSPGAGGALNPRPIDFGAGPSLGNFGDRTAASDRPDTSPFCRTSSNVCVNASERKALEKSVDEKMKQLSAEARQQGGSGSQYLAFLKQKVDSLVDMNGLVAPLLNAMVADAKDQPLPLSVRRGMITAIQNMGKQGRIRMFPNLSDPNQLSAWTRVCGRSGLSDNGFAFGELGLVFICPGAVLTAAFKSQITGRPAMNFVAHTTMHEVGHVLHAFFPSAFNTLGSCFASLSPRRALSSSHFGEIVADYIGNGGLDILARGLSKQEGFQLVKDNFETICGIGESASHPSAERIRMDRVLGGDPRHLAREGCDERRASCTVAGRAGQGLRLDAQDAVAKH